MAVGVFVPKFMVPVLVLGLQAEVRCPMLRVQCPPRQTHCRLIPQLLMLSPVLGTQVLGEVTITMFSVQGLALGFRPRRSAVSRSHDVHV